MFKIIFETTQSADEYRELKIIEQKPQVSSHSVGFIYVYHKPNNMHLFLNFKRSLQLLKQPNLGVQIPAIEKLVSGYVNSLWILYVDNETYVWNLPSRHLNTLISATDYTGMYILWCFFTVYQNDQVQNITEV
jgi:hypothetical protein